MVAASAAWLVARPSSVGRLALLLAAATVAIVLELPALGSHLLLVLAVAVCVLVHLGAGLVRPGRTPGIERPAGGEGAVALVLCAASPYVGWRAGDAFTMYSGLRTSPTAWNHVLLPPAVRVRGPGGPQGAPGSSPRSERSHTPR